MTRLASIFLGDLIAISNAIDFIDKETEMKQIQKEKIFF